MKGFDDKVAQVGWDDDELKEYLKWVKNEDKYKIPYNRAKRVVHGSNYGLTATGLKLTYPEDFPTVKSAQAVIDLMFDLFPSIKQWQQSVRHLAHKQHYLGGEAHPYKYRHWFWDVFTYKRINEATRRKRQSKGDPVVQFGNFWYAVGLGSDSKRCIAYLPQSTAGGVIRDACLRLFTPGSDYYIGDVYYGRTPFRMPIHDSLVLEVPDEKVDFTLERLLQAMKVPVEVQPLPWDEGKFLEIDVDVEVGRNWGEMEKVA
jgi:DNA polymerase I-like protein with 3'-5' exonuclease and polymerase domains